MSTFSIFSNLYIVFSRISAVIISTNTNSPLFGRSSTVDQISLFELLGKDGEGGLPHIDIIDYASHCFSRVLLAYFLGVPEVQHCLIARTGGSFANQFLKKTQGI